MRGCDRAAFAAEAVCARLRRCPGERRRIGTVAAGRMGSRPVDMSIRRRKPYPRRPSAAAAGAETPARARTGDRLAPCTGLESNPPGRGSVHGRRWRQGALSSRTTEVMLAGATVRALEDTLGPTNRQCWRGGRLNSATPILAEALKDALESTGGCGEIGEPAAAASPVGGGANGDRQGQTLPPRRNPLSATRTCSPKPAVATRRRVATREVALDVAERAMRARIDNAQAATRASVASCRRPGVHLGRHYVM